MKGNAGTTGAPSGRLTMKADMAEYDRLPAVIRQRLQVMTENWNAAPVRAVVANYGIASAITVLDKVEGDMQSAYRSRIGA